MNFQTKKPLILIVDDSPQNLQVLGMILEGVDCDIAVASDGKQALKTAKEQLPDLILLDVMMPVMNGHEACKKLKENPVTADIPVIFLTALGDAEDIRLGFQLGAVDYIQKPFNGVELLARVKSHLNNKKILSELEFVNATKNKFFSIIAHDLKNPFHTIIGFSEMLMKNIDTLSKEDQLKYLELIYTSGKDAHTLLENLLDWSRMQVGTIKGDMVLLSSVEVIELALHFLEPMARKKSIKLLFDPKEDYELYADENMLNTMLRNLGSNAIKFTHDGGTVRFSTKLADGGKGVSFIVEDNGIGMSQSTVSELFRIDAKQSRTGTGNETGTGLGLILCKEFAEFHRGSISVESEECKGSKFVITLPVKH